MVDNPTTVNATMRAAIAQHDWGATPLGPIEGWPASLRTVLGLVLDTPFAMLVMWGPDLVQVYNDGYVPIFGDKHPRSLGQPAHGCWADIWDDVGPLLLGVYERGEAVFFENLPLMMQRGGRHEQGYFTFSYSPIREADAVRGIMCVVNETTAHVLRERETQERAEALAEIDRVKTQFFNNVSHEFRTPLTLMLGPLEELARTLPDYEHRQAADLALRNAVRLQKLVNTLLDFSLVQSGMARRSLRACEVGTLTADLASEFRSAFERAGLSLQVDVDSGLVATIDDAMYEKIVLNLLSNALKFTFSGGARVSAVRENEEFVLTVADTGTGISATELPHLFQRFRRVQGARSRSHEGSGIGLALVHELVSLLGGTIRVESAPDVGSTFTVRLPLRSNASPAGTVADPGETAQLRRGFREEADALVRDAPMPVAGGNATGARIFVADDNADLRAYLARILGPRYNVALVADGAELLAAIDPEAPPDLVVLDIMMPNVDGFECARRLRADPRTSLVPVLFLSARAGDEAVVQGLAHGDEYIVKPFVAADLLARVENLLQRFDERRRGDGERRDLVRERREHTVLASAADRFIAAVDTASVAAAATAALVPEFADWSVLYRTDDSGKLAALSVSHHEPVKAELGMLLDRRYPYHLNDGTPSSSVFQTGEPLLIESVTPERLRGVARNEEHATILASLGLRSLAIVPVEIGGAVAAVLATIRSENTTGFDERDLAFLQRFAARTALALESVAAYERDRTIALTLQRALLPGALPDVPGLRFSASYAPAALESLIGGDWYDAFVLSDGRVCLSIGDVVGHGLGAATIMATLRQNIRALAPQVASPQDVLRRLNELLAGQEIGRLATAIVALIDPVTLVLTIASAGHPAPLLIHADGEVEVLPAVGVMLGVVRDAQFEERHVQLLPGESVAFYTDGYVENERDAIAGEARLVEALRATRGLDDPAPQVHVDVLENGAPRDDAALLILAVAASQPRLNLRLPATPEAASGARAPLRRFFAASGLDEARQFDMLVAVGEAIINAVEHAYAGGGGHVLVRGTVEDGDVFVEIEDLGTWSERFGKKEQRGYGLPLMHAFSRIVSIERKPTGTRVRLSSRVEAAAVR